MSDNLLESSTTELATMADSRSMIAWSDEKRKDFINTFNTRACRGKAILAATSLQMIAVAVRRKFINPQVGGELERDTWNALPEMSGYNRPGVHPTDDEIKKIGEERAERILANLPVLKNAVRVIDEELFQDMEKHEGMKAAFKVLSDQLEELSDPINLAEVDQKMTIGDFRKMVIEVQKTKDRLRSEMNTQSSEMYALESSIAKRLYKGIPGLTDAVVSVIKQHIERISALNAMGRRVEERVKFGDSPEALKILEHFEADEVAVSETIAAEFSKAMEVLKKSSTTKKLTTAKKKKK